MPGAPKAAAPSREIPGPSWLEGLGSLLSQRDQRIDMRSRLERLERRYGPVVMQRAGPFRMVNLFGPDANRLVLQDREGIFSARRPWMAIMGRIFPNGLLLRDGRDHRHHRRILYQAFKPSALSGYLDRMNPMIERALEGWGAGPGPLRAFPAVKELTLDVAATIFLGAELGPATREMNGIFEDLVAASMSRVRLRIPGLEFQRGLLGREKLLAWLAELLPARRAGAGSDLASRLCHAENEQGEQLSDPEILDHLVFLMMAAHDTTTSTLCSMTYELARHPDWQERLRQESFALGEAPLGFADLPRLEGIGWTLKETLRRYPPLPVIPRVATSAFSFAGYEIPEGSLVVIAPIHSHHQPEWWRAPEVFDPERFAPARQEDQRHDYLWIPFGGGAHHCLGLRFAELQVKAVVHQLLRRYRVTVASGYRMPVQQAPISKPRDGLPIRLEPVARRGARAA